MRPLFNFALALVGGLLVVQLTVSTLRDLFQLRTDRTAVPLEEVELPFSELIYLAVDAAHERYRARNETMDWGMLAKSSGIVGRISTDVIRFHRHFD